MATTPRLSSARARWLAALTGAVIIFVAGFAYQAHLAFTPDKAIAAAIRRRVGSSRGLDAVRGALATRYRVMGTWTRSSFIRDRSEPDGPGVQVLVGEYRGIPFVTSVDAFVWLDEAGAVKAVRVRRTTDGL